MTDFHEFQGALIFDLNGNVIMVFWLFTQKSTGELEHSKIQKEVEKILIASK